MTTWANPGESDYERTARALNDYAAKGDKAAYDSAVAYAKSKGWGSMVPSTPSGWGSSSSSNSGSSGSSYSNPIGTSLRDWGKNNNVNIGYNPSSNTVSVGNRTTGAGSIPGTTNYNGYNYITDNGLFDQWLNGSNGNSNLNNGQSSYTMEQVQQMINESLKNYQPNQPTVNTNEMWDQFMNWAAPYMQKPQVDTPTYESISQQIKEQLQPLHEETAKQLEQSRDEAIKSLAANLASRGVYNSDINETKAAELYGKYDNAKAMSDASYESDIANKATSLYNDAANRATNLNQSYNQSMINLGLALMNGMIDMNQFVMDDAYRNAELARIFGQDALANFGVAG